MEGGGQGDSIVLEEEIDPNYEPTKKEVLEYATWLGMDLDAERDLFWIAREGLKAPLPENWKPCKTTDTEEIYYFNFATGQSTWDHPCDEFYRNLYEEHKSKRQTKDVQETDEKKKKVKEDVAELLGRKSGGKKKKGSLAKTEPLSGPSLGKVNVLEKKPLPGLSGRFGSLGSSGFGGGGLKPVAGLGPLKSEAKDLGGDSAVDNIRNDELAKPLSRTPLGSALGKKPLSSSSSTTAVETKLIADSNFEEKRERLAQDHAEKLREIRAAHDSELEALRKKLNAQLEDVQDAEEMKLKQLKREFDKKKNDLENNFDREENTLQRNRKDQLKRLETDSENALSNKKQDLDREFKSETDKLRLQHEAKQREIEDDFVQETKQLTEKMKLLFGEKKEAAQVAIDLKNKVEQLLDQQRSLKRELDAARNEKESLLLDKDTAEKEHNNAQRDVLELRRQLSEANRSETSAASVEGCTKCSTLEDRISSLKGVCTETQNEAERLRNELSVLKKECEAQTAADSDKVDLLKTLRDQEVVLKQEITALQQQIIFLEAESGRLRTQCATLEARIDKASQGNLTRKGDEQLEVLQRQLSVAQTEVTNTKTELSDLQDQHAVILTTNAQIKEQLMKESNERKVLREQLESAAEIAAQHLAVEVEKYQQQIHDLQQKVENESQRRHDQEDKCATLQKYIDGLEQAKREMECKLSQAESDKQELKSAVSDNTDGKRRLIDFEEEVSRLNEEQGSLMQELDTLRFENEVLQQEKEATENQCQLIRREMEELQKQPAKLNQQELSTIASQECTQCSVLEARVLSLKSECTEARMEVEKVREQLVQLQEQVEAGAVAEREGAKVANTILQREKDDIAQAFQDKETLLKQEISVLQQKLGVLEAESSDLRTKCDFLQSEKNSADRRESDISSSVSVVREQMKLLERKLTASQTEVTSTKAELHDLQNQHANLLIMNAQTKEQLVKETNEKKMFREQLDSIAEEDAQLLAGITEKHQQQILSLQQQLESESRARREREDEYDTLRKEVHALEQAKRKVDAELGQLASDKRHLESEKSMLALRLDEMNITRKRDEKSVMSVEEALTDKKLEVEQLRANLKVVEVDKQHLEARMKVLSQDLEQLQTKMHRLEADYESERTRSRSIEKERDTALQRQQGLVDELGSIQRKYRSMTADVSELQSQLSKAKASEQAASSKVEQSAQKIRLLEQQVERDGFATKMKHQQTEVELENIIHAKERAEMQSQIKEKELAAVKEEVTRRESEIESLQARVKSLLCDKEEVQTALLNASMVNVATASANREPSKAISASTDVMLVKLQLADANRTELELHLADISSQLENSTRRCTLLEARCRDQSIEIESLHVEVASLRSASQKMHMSALESLALVERLEYEHKKRTLRNDYLNQLRDFQEREEQALIRHKARLRAQYERHLEDLVAELEKVRQQRVEQEEALSVQMMQQIRQERDVKRNEAKRQIREELTQFEQELHERKARDIEIISKAIEREEDDLGARLREIRQVVREEELAKQLKTPGYEVKPEVLRDCQTPAPSGQAGSRRSYRQNQLENLDDDDEEYPVSEKRTKVGNQQQHPKRLDRLNHRQTGKAKTYQKWKQRLQEEIDLLANARTMITSQRQGLTKQAQRLKASKNDWRRSSRSSESNPIQREMKRMLDENMANWSEGMSKLRKQESWVKQREQKLAKMKRTVERLGRGQSDAYECHNKLSGPSGSSSDEDDETRAEWSDYSNQSELTSTLEKLEKLEEELAFDSQSFCEGYPRQIDDRRRNEFHPVYESPQSYVIQRNAYRCPLSSPMVHFTPRRAIQTGGGIAGQDMRWIRSDRVGFGLRDRHTVVPMSSVSCNDQVYQQKISRWAKGREKVQHAATNHATWLSGLCEELKEYGAKYTRVDGEPEDSSGMQFIQNVDDD